MKKIFLRFASVLTIASVLFFACKKEKVVEETCGATLTVKATVFETKANIFIAKVNNNPSTYTKAECVALKAEALGLIAEARTCPQTSSNTVLIAELQSDADEFECP